MYYTLLARNNVQCIIKCNDFCSQQTQHVWNGPQTRGRPLGLLQRHSQPVLPPGGPAGLCHHNGPSYISWVIALNWRSLMGLISTFFSAVVLFDEARNQTDPIHYQEGVAFAAFDTVLEDDICEEEQVGTYWMPPENVFGLGFAIDRGNNNPVTRIKLKNAQGDPWNDR